MVNRILIFSGTTEGRELTEWLSSCDDLEVTARVATEYGAQVCKDVNVDVGSCGGAEGIAKTISDGGYDLVIDATHPYASRITEHIREACSMTGVELIRIKRNDSEMDGVIMVPSIEDVPGILNDTEGNILVTTGSKEADVYTRIGDFKERVFIRVLPIPNSLNRCVELGYPNRNIICAQGPFSVEMNVAMLKQFDISYMVTKDSGDTGGFDAKYEAAVRSDVKLIVIGRPEDEGLPYERVVDMLSERFGIERHVPKRKISLIGIGLGGDTMTLEARNAISEADLVIGAKRMLETSNVHDKATYEGYLPKDVMGYIESNPDHRRIAVLLSGDVGFYSGAKGLIASIDESRYDVDVICGIPSLVYFFSKIGKSWDDAHLISSHGRSMNTINHVSRYPKVFTLLSSSDELKKILSDMCQFGLDHVIVTVGSDLNSEEEKIIEGRPSELLDRTFGKLNVALFENGDVMKRTSCIPDDQFIRGDAPMSKSEVRALSVSKLDCDSDSIIYDIGAGTGSVSVELALRSIDGTVYAIEKEHDAIALVEENRRRFKVQNIVPIEGIAPEALRDLPSPTHVFIGGSSGNLKDILSCVLEKNPHVRIVINAVTLETLSEILEIIRSFDLIEEEIICLSVDRMKKVGRYHMMDSQNPVYICVVRG